MGGASVHAIGLLVSLVGALLVGISTHAGWVTGFVGVIVWTNLWWRVANAAGWLLLVLGFLLQWLEVRKAGQCAPSSGELQIVVSLLERKGLLTQQEVLEEIGRVKQVRGQGR